ncbi:MAG: Wzz/FepE/Etk N-terminal domain-containing protein, partial [Pseudomonadota bacterium]|nr:Wzz/FepE/Etk N-terminal domain-containing protein [Pseudomonadota bacterium]
MNNLPPTPQPGPNQLPMNAGGYALAEHQPGFLPPPAEAKESPLREYWRIFFKRRLIIIAITAFCIALGILMAMLTQREYAATVTVQVSRDTAKILNIEGLEQAADPYDQEFYETQYELLKSRSLAEAVARDLRLADNYRFLSNFEADEAESMEEVDRAARFTMATEIVSENTVVEPVTKSSIINIRYNSPNPV